MKNNVKWFYKWHRRLGLLATVPILAWCLSGLAHPMMAHFFKLRPAHRAFPMPEVGMDSTTLFPHHALRLHQIDTLQQLRWVEIEGEPYYQVQLPQEKFPLYIHRETGALLEKGDALYARQLARHFLGDSTQAIQSVEVVQRFNQNYKFINRFLPAHRVAFDRPDGMAVYVHTPSSRLGTLNDHRRRQYLWLFSQFHNWDFLKAVPSLRLPFMLLWLVIGGFVALSGLLLYGVWWKHWRGNERQASKSRRWHRRIGLLVACSTLAFVFSGGYHAVAKVQGQKTAKRPKPLSSFPTSAFESLPTLWATFNMRSVHQIGLVKLEEQIYFQVDWADPKTPTSYFNIQTLQTISQGEERYALALAKHYSDLPDAAVDSVLHKTKFGGEYGFINKRLPVHAVHYQTPEKHSIYVETRTGDLATVITTPKRREALSFLLLHKYHFLDPLGKAVRDGVIVLLLLGIVVVHVLGMILWWRTRAVN